MPAPQTDASSSNAASARPAVRLAFWLLILLYAALILYRPAFNLIDDHKFLDTVCLGRVLPPFILYEQGRFSPLLAQEYNLVALVSSTPRAFYAFNVVELLVVAWLLVRIGQAVPARKHPAVPYLTTVAILLSPGFTVSWFRLWVQEKDELLLLSAFLLAYLGVRASGRRGLALVSLLFATLALYSKESAFVPVGAIGLFGLWLDRAPGGLTPAQRNTWQGLHVLLLTSCAVFLGAYYGIVYRHRGQHLYNEHSGSKIAHALHTVAGSMIHEPVLLLVLVLLAWRAFVPRRTPTSASFRVLLLACLSLVCAYVVLGLSNTYYLLPAYFAVPYLLCAAAETPALSRVFRQPWLVFALCLLLLNQGMVAVQQVTLWRTGADDLQTMLPHLEQELKQPGRANLFLDGLRGDLNGEVFLGLGAFLRASGLTAQQFDLLSNVSIDTTSTYYLPTQSEFSYTGQVEKKTPLPGDLLLVTPADTDARRAQLPDRNAYVLLFQTNSATYSNYSLKTLLRRVFRQPLGDDVVIDPNYRLYRKLPAHG